MAVSQASPRMPPPPRTSRSGTSKAAATPGRRALGVVTAAREPLRRLPGPPGVPWPERVLCCALGEVEVINLHSPIAPAPELAKVRTHEAVAAYLSKPARGPRVLCGDLNTPRREMAARDVL